jgi:transposase
MDWTALFPHLADLLLLLRYDVGADGLVLDVTPQARTACCPSCHHPSDAVHSHYLRHVTDVPLGSHRVTLQLHVRRFRCRNSVCRRQTFADDLSPIVSRYARRSVRLRALLEDIGIHLGGRPGARFTGRHRLSVSRSTLLRLVRRLPLPPHMDPAVILGVDDFALRRHHQYGTLLVDVEHHRMLDLWPERTAEPFVAWLSACERQPEVICRDRGGAYADAARQAAPQAIQVADRFHLVRNAGDVLQRILARHAAAVRALTAPAPTDPADTASPAGCESAPHGCASQPAAQPACPTAGATTRERRRARYDQVVALRAQGLSLTAVATQVGLSRPTIRKYLTAGTFPEWAPRRTLLRTGSGYTMYLQQRWAEGCRDATVLWSELPARGFTGSLRMVQRAVARWRPRIRARGPRRRQPPIPGGLSRPARLEAAESSPGRVTQPLDLPPSRGISPQQAAWLLLRHPDTLNNSEQVLRTQIVDISPEIRLARELLETFCTILKQREATHLDCWLQRAITSGIAELRGFAFGLKRDNDAVRAAATVVWSSGQVEGQITKVKLIKRQMYGRAKFELSTRYPLFESGV